MKLSSGGPTLRTCKSTNQNPGCLNIENCRIGVYTGTVCLQLLGSSKYTITPFLKGDNMCPTALFNCFSKDLEETSNMDDVVQNT